MTNNRNFTNNTVTNTDSYNTSSIIRNKYNNSHIIFNNNIGIFNDNSHVVVDIFGYVEHFGSVTSSVVIEVSVVIITIVSYVDVMHTSRQCIGNYFNFTVDNSSVILSTIDFNSNITCSSTVNVNSNVSTVSSLNRINNNINHRNSFPHFKSFSISSYIVFIVTIECSNNSVVTCS